MTTPIPNILALGAVFSFYALGIVAVLPVDVLISNTLCAALMFAALVILYVTGSLGAGVVKLLAALSLWYGFSTALLFFVMSVALLIGIWGGLNLLYALIRGRKETQNVPALPPVAVAFSLTVSQSDIFQRLATTFFHLDAAV